MSNKDKFKNPKARHVGGDLLAKDKSLIEEMNLIGNERDEEEPKTHSLTILPSHIEKIRNYVHFKKINGNPYYTQGQMLQEAIDLFIKSLGFIIPERPEEIKKLEMRKTGRKRRNKSGLDNDFKFQP